MSSNIILAAHKDHVFKTVIPVVNIFYKQFVCFFKSPHLSTRLAGSWGFFFFFFHFFIQQSGKLSNIFTLFLGIYSLKKVFGIQCEFENYLGRVYKNQEKMGIK